MQVTGHLNCEFPPGSLLVNSGTLDVGSSCYCSSKSFLAKITESLSCIQDAKKTHFVGWIYHHKQGAASNCCLLSWRPISSTFRGHNSRVGSIVARGLFASLLHREVHPHFEITYLLFSDRPAMCLAVASKGVCPTPWVL